MSKSNLCTLAKSQMRNVSWIGITFHLGILPLQSDEIMVCIKFKVCGHWTDRYCNLEISSILQCRKHVMHITAHSGRELLCYIQ